MPIQTIEEDEEVELSANTFVRNNYEFVGWALTVSRHVAFEDKQIVKNLTDKDAETISLYAVWER